jgi:intron-binding protein aquarius
MCLDVILSLTRTLRPGYLRDLRRLTVALSRSRLGLYILGRKAVFESCYEIQDAFHLLFERPTKLQVVSGEMFPTQRLIDDEVESVEMTGVEHLGQYVFEMTGAKVKALKEGGGVLPMAPVEEEEMDEDEDEGGVVDEDVPEEPEEEEEFV